MVLLVIFSTLNLSVWYRFFSKGFQKTQPIVNSPKPLGNWPFCVNYLVHHNTTLPLDYHANLPWVTHDPMLTCLCVDTLKLYQLIASITTNTKETCPIPIGPYLCNKLFFKTFCHRLKKKLKHIFAKIYKCNRLIVLTPPTQYQKRLKTYPNKIPSFKTCSIFFYLICWFFKWLIWWFGWIHSPDFTNKIFFLFNSWKILVVWSWKKGEVLVARSKLPMGCCNLYVFLSTHLDVQQKS